MATARTTTTQDISAYTLDDVQSVVELFTGRTGHYIFASSAVVYAQTETYPYVEGDPLDAREDASDYSKNKQLCEAYLWGVQAQGKLPVTSTRYAMVYGPHNNSWQREHLMMLRLLQGRPALLPGTGNTLITVGHVDDQSRALTAMMGNPRTFGQAYTVTGPDCVTDNGYVRTLAGIIGVEPRIIYMPPAVMDSLSPEQRRPLIQRVGKPNQHWSTHDVYSMEKMKSDLDFTHEYSFESGMRQTFAWFMAEGMDKKIEYDFSLEERLAAEHGGQ
ncbi:MAG: NAD-dependent epimerase/dehydratase family protein [Chloroflexi bacterium]|nr:NAD-dependent epimerase/dehydratase family protein [Chloroflexota bacterium]